MTEIKLCGLTRDQDIEIANKLKPEYIGFVFWDRSSRNVSAMQAARLKGKLDPEIKAVGVFVNAPAEQVISLHNVGIIDVAQLHGNENEDYIKKLHDADMKVIKAFKMKKADENEHEEIFNKEEIRETSEKTKNSGYNSADNIISEAIESSADYIMFDPGKGEGATFNWQLIKDVEREFFLAGGLTPENVGNAVKTVHPFAVDVSSGIENDGHKDEEKMTKFVENVREKS